MSYLVNGSNDFYAGWLAFVLGEPAPRKGSVSEGWLTGWDTAADTKSLSVISEAMVKMRKLRQVVVETQP